MGDRSRQILRAPDPTADYRVTEFAAREEDELLPVLGGGVRVRPHQIVPLCPVGDPPVAWWCPDGHDHGDEDE